VQRAVERTVPFGFLAQTLVIVWYTLFGYHPDDLTARHAAEPWYDKKAEPAFEDMLAKLRCALIAARFNDVSPAQPDSHKYRDHELACAAAAAQLRNSSCITRLGAVLDAEPQAFQVGINFADAVKLTGACAAEQAVRRTSDAGRYVLADAVASGPAMLDTARLDQAGGVDGSDPDLIAALGRRAAPTALHTATLDEILCTTAASQVGGLVENRIQAAVFDGHQVARQVGVAVVTATRLNKTVADGWP